MTLGEHAVVEEETKSGWRWVCSCGRQGQVSRSPGRSRAAGLKHAGLSETPAVERDSPTKPDGTLWRPHAERDRLTSDGDAAREPSPYTRIRKLYDDLAYAHVHNDEDGGPSLYRLDLLTSIIEAAEQARELDVQRARARGASWERIGQQIGRTKQAAQMRYGKKASTTKSLDGDQLTIEGTE